MPELSRFAGMIIYLKPGRIPPLLKRGMNALVL